MNSVHQLTIAGFFGAQANRDAWVTDLEESGKYEIDGILLQVLYGEKTKRKKERKKERKKKTAWEYIFVYRQCFLLFMCCCTGANID